MGVIRYTVIHAVRLRIICLTFPMRFQSAVYGGNVFSTCSDFCLYFMRVVTDMMKRGDTIVSTSGVMKFQKLQCRMPYMQVQCGQKRCMMTYFLPLHIICFLIFVGTGFVTNRQRFVLTYLPICVMMMTGDHRMEYKGFLQV